MRNKKSLIIAATASAGLLMGTASAEEMRWYAGGGLNLTSLKTKGLPDVLEEEGLTVLSGEASDTSFGFQLQAGLMVTSNFGVELRYSDSGDAKDTIRAALPEEDPVDVNLKVSLDGFTLYGVGELPVADNFAVFGKLGYTWQDVKATVSGDGASVSISDDDSGIAAAAGVRYLISDNWSVTGEVEYLDVDFDGGLKKPVRGSVNLEYRF